MSTGDLKHLTTLISNDRSIYFSIKAHSNLPSDYRIVTNNCTNRVDSEMFACTEDCLSTLSNASLFQ